MCGIAGEIRFDGKAASTDAVERMNEIQSPRGPDGHGVWQRGHIALGHTRLKIIDLSDRGAQPMEDPDLGLTLVFNGCIYNYPDLRAELADAGHTFRSTSDTEVILKAYAQWGEDCVQHFNGMFAFVLVEHASGKVFAARDRLGVKPFYFTDRDGVFRFASSLPALMAADTGARDINPVALHHYMSFHSVVPAPHTIVDGFEKLPPSTVMTISAEGQRRQRRYWAPQYLQPGDQTADFDTLKDELLEELTAAVRRRMVADVPVGVLLSGGVDSSLVVALLAECGTEHLETFSIGFEGAGEEEGDEFRYSDLIAKTFGTEHHKIVVSSEGLVEHLPACFRAMSEPMVSHDNIAFYLLSREVSRHLKVVQSGQGADEVFGGYHWYPPMDGSDDPVSDYARAFFDREHAEFCEAVNPRFHGEDESRRFVARHFDTEGAHDPVDKALHMDTTVMLVDDPLKRVDNMTMAWALEARVPFLDYRLVEFAARVPSSMKIRPEGKYILKEAARRVLPAEVIDRPKGYFPVPELKYLSGPSLDFVKDAMASRAARERGLFNDDYLNRLLAAPADHITPLRGSKLWQLAVLEVWLQTHGA